MNDTRLLSCCWLWEKSVPPEVCENIIETYYEQGTAEKAELDQGVVEDYRKTDVCWIPPTEAVSLLLFSKCLIANAKAGWRFDIEENSPTQIAKYENGGFCGWHSDEVFHQHHRGHHRKVSAVLFLSDPSTYTGGDFFIDATVSEVKIKADRGTVVCFPSEVRHKVTPVTEGVRYSLVSWAIGPFMK